MSDNKDFSSPETVVGEPIGQHGNLLAPAGYVYECQACGKTSKDKYGNQSLSYGWDVSCMLNSMLVKYEPK